MRRSGVAKPLQREFALFGGEFLLTLGAKRSASMSAAFALLDRALALPRRLAWASRKPPPRDAPRARLRVDFDAAACATILRRRPRLPPSVALKLAACGRDYSLNHGLGLLRSLAPVFGDGEP